MPNDLDPPTPGTTDYVPAPLSSRHRVFAIIWTLLLCGAILWPLRANFQPGVVDSFPFSYYPMFAANRPEYNVYTYVIAERSDGSRVRIPYRFYAKGGMNQARRQLMSIVKDGRRRTSEMCDKIARTLRRESDPTYRELVTVKIVTGHYRFAEYFLNDNRHPARETVHVQCSVAKQDSRHG